MPFLTSFLTLPDVCFSGFFLMIKHITHPPPSSNFSFPASTCLSDTLFYSYVSIGSLPLWSVSTLRMEISDSLLQGSIPSTRTTVWDMKDTQYFFAYWMNMWMHSRQSLSVKPWIFVGSFFRILSFRCVYGREKGEFHHGTTLSRLPSVETAYGRCKILRGAAKKMPWIAVCIGRTLGNLEMWTAITTRSVPSRSERTQVSVQVWALMIGKNYTFHLPIELVKKMFLRLREAIARSPILFSKPQGYVLFFKPYSQNSVQSPP